MNYSQEIKDRIEKYIDEVSSNIKEMPTEEKSDLIQCLREHIDDALVGLGIENPTIEDLESVIEEMDSADSYKQTDIPIESGKSNKKATKVLVITLTLIVIAFFPAMFGGLIVYGLWNSTENKPTENKRPPVVISTYPSPGSKDVDPDLKEIKVTFDGDMLTDRQWSWCYESKETFPVMEPGSVKYIDKRTCVAQVKLEPDRTYVIWFNTEKFTNFKDVYRNPAIPYRLEFHTGKK